MAKIKKVYKNGVEYEFSGGGAVPVVNHGTSDKGTSESPFVLTPNVLHVWGTVDALYLTLGTPEAGVMNEYMFEFISGTTATTISGLPAALKWAEGLDVDADTRYQVSIVNNVGLIVGVDTV